MNDPTAPAITGPFYKVLYEGRSVHGGDHTWSLPTADGPGEWQTLPAGQREPILCERGFHLTNEPALWYGHRYTVYLAEFRGLVAGPGSGNEADKIAVQECRLVREVTGDELAAMGIYTGGIHTARTSGPSHAYDSAQVTAYDSAQVTAYGSAQVKAYDSAQVTAYDSAQVKAYGSAQVKAYDSAQVTAYDSAQVTAYGSAQVKAEGRVTVTKQSRWCSISLLGLAVAVDWTSERADLIRSTPEAALCSAT